LKAPHPAIAGLLAGLDGLRKARPTTAAEYTDILESYAGLDEDSYYSQLASVMRDFADRVYDLADLPRGIQDLVHGSLSLTIDRVTAFHPNSDLVRALNILRSHLNR